MVEELIALEEEAKRAEEHDGARKDAAAGEKKKKKQATEMRDRALERTGGKGQKRGEREMQRMQHEQFMKQLEANQRPQIEQMRMF